jgi:hypothetical protein
LIFSPLLMPFHYYCHYSFRCQRHCRYAIIDADYAAIMPLHAAMPLIHYADIDIDAATLFTLRWYCWQVSS